MTREDKSAAIAELREELSNSPFFYLADSSTLTVAKINKFRRMCFEKDIRIKVAKNTLIQKALEGEAADFDLDPNGKYGWLGDDQRGLCWFCESNRGWNAPGNGEIELLPGKDARLLRINFIRQPVTLGEPRKFTFGLMPTPVKPASP